jgi:sugar lactone lactonase YvrE
MKKYIYQLLGLPLIFSLQAQAQISTIAGTGAGGHAGDGGSATTGQVFAPAGMARDAAGNIYVADQFNNAVRKISGGNISTIAGTFVAGYSGDTGSATVATAAMLNQPFGVAVDGAGNIYIADMSNHRIRKVTSAGVISTIAGTGAAGYNGDGIQATAAKLYNPSGVAVDGHGNVYISDRWNNRIRKIDTGGVISTIAGTGAYGFNTDSWPSAKLAMVARPLGIMIDAAGSVIFADQDNSRIRKVDSNGVITTIAGHHSGFCDYRTLDENAPCLSYPASVAMDTSGNLYVGDAGNRRVRLIYKSGYIKTIAGTGTNGYSGDGGPGQNANVSQANGLAVDNAGNVYFSDWGNNRVRYVVATVGVADINNNKTGEIEIYPNPVRSNGSFTVNINTAVAESATLFVTDITGTKIKETAINTNIATEFNLDVPSGLYILTATTSNGKWNKKIEVIH